MDKKMHQDGDDDGGLTEDDSGDMIPTNGREVVMSVMIPRKIDDSGTTPITEHQIIWVPASVPQPPPLYSIKQLNYAQVNFKLQLNTKSKLNWYAFRKLLPPHNRHHPTVTIAAMKKWRLQLQATTRTSAITPTSTWRCPCHSLHPSEADFRLDNFKWLVLREWRDCITKRTHDRQTYNIKMHTSGRPNYKTNNISLKTNHCFDTINIDFYWIRDHSLRTRKFLTKQVFLIWINPIWSDWIFLGCIASLLHKERCFFFFFNNLSTLNIF